MPALRTKTREQILPYDIEAVMKNHMLPALDQIATDLKKEPQAEWLKRRDRESGATTVQLLPPSRIAKPRESAGTEPGRNVDEGLRKGSRAHITSSASGANAMAKGAIRRMCYVSSWTTLVGRTLDRTKLSFMGTGPNEADHL
jgi:hypothetical protein